MKKYSLLILGIVIIISCNNESSIYQYAISQPYNETRIKLIEKLNEMEIQYIINKNGTILIKKSDAALVNQMRREIDDKVNPIKYSAEFSSLADANLFASALSANNILYDLKEVGHSRFKIVCTVAEDYKKAEAIMDEYLKHRYHK